MLYIFWFLHQTTTHRKNGNDDAELYIFWFLHQTTTGKSINSRRAELYIFWFLHQTTTLLVSGLHFPGCISFDSYIKPQLLVSKLHKIAVVYLLIPTSNHNITQTDMFWRSVVYLLIPTSNHNHKNVEKADKPLYIFWFLHQTTTLDAHNRGTSKLYIFWFLHQTTTMSQWQLAKSALYIFWFLHQTTTYNIMLRNLEVLYIFWFLHQTTTRFRPLYGRWRCISFDSYIKPQPSVVWGVVRNVVYLLIPTSNHNL